MINFDAIKRLADKEYLAASIAAVYNSLRRPQPGPFKMYQYLSTVATYCMYAIAGVTVPSLAIYILYPAITYDLSYLRRLVRVLAKKRNWYKRNFTIIDRFEEHVSKQGGKTFLYYDGCKFSYDEMNKWANRLMNYLLGARIVGLRDVVCMLMFNEPLYVATWLAIAKCGATAAMLNNHIRGKSLLHCIKISGSKLIICGSDPELLEALTEIKQELDEDGIQIYVLGVIDKPLAKGFTDLTAFTQDSSDQNNVDARKEIQVAKDSCVYIYTSGTTGLPKATNMGHGRCVTASSILSIYDMTKDDIFYLCLPLYHSAGFSIGLTGVINEGASAVIRKKFSVREFWADVRRYRITVIQYIGETARYLIQAPRSDQDGKYAHGSVKLAVGNGLPMDIWQEFQERFNVDRVGEYYGASEGNYLIINFDGKVGSVGRYTPLQSKLVDVLQILECDLETAEPKRGPDGLCILCPNGKPGLLATKISKTLPIDGYVGDRKITEKKMVRDVARKGDCYFNTGDLMLIDKDGYVFFKDRLGNTFRWKGENVATTEVELALLENSQVESANVYGIKIEGKDGRAGMASLILQNNATLNSQAMYEHITERLPNYACPKVIRIKESIEVTGTFKHRKVNLIKEGFDPRTVADPLYYMNDKEKTYSVLDEDSFNSILAGTIRM